MPRQQTASPDRFRQIALDSMSGSRTPAPNPQLPEWATEEHLPEWEAPEEAPPQGTWEAGANALARPLRGIYNTFDSPFLNASSCW